MSDILIKAEGVSKKFCKISKYAMLYGLHDIARTMLGIQSRANQLRSAEFWAVDNISFELRRGECLGLIGPNGSGKSTLLKILNGIISPDKGSVTIKGKVGALIEIGAGFHPMLTGRENIFINGSILGFTRKEIGRKFDRIVEFSELSEFIDTPVKHYSSGMRVRLGFAIAAQMNPDLLLIDEVLAVGDIGFKAKCFNAIADLTRKCAVIFVSHNMANVAKLSSDILLLKEGRKEYQGKNVSEGIYSYFDQYSFEKGVPFGEDTVLLKNCKVHGEAQDNGVVKYLEDIFVDIEFAFLKECKTDILMLIFTNNEYSNVAVTYLTIPDNCFKTNSTNRLTTKVSSNPFSSGQYSITIAFAESIKGSANGKVISQYHSAVSFKVIDSKTVSNIPMQLESELVDPQVG